MIAFFDSGVGGMTVMKPVMELMPEYDYVYLGDCARTPYGNHSPEIIREYCEQAVNKLFNLGVKLIIFACNTASSNGLRFIQREYILGGNYPEKKVLGVLIPIAESAIEHSKNKQIGIVGTRATTNSKAYDKELKKLDSNIKIYSKALPLLVPLIEESWHKKPEAKSILKKYLREIKSYNIDTLILGCTHYPFMQKEFQKVMGKKVKVLNTGEIVAKKLKEYLTKHSELEKSLSKSSKRTFYTTDRPEKMKSFIEKHCGMKIPMPQKIDLTKI